MHPTIKFSKNVSNGGGGGEGEGEGDPFPDLHNVPLHNDGGLPPHIIIIPTPPPPHSTPQ